MTSVSIPPQFSDNLVNICHFCAVVLHYSSGIEVSFTAEHIFYGYSLGINFGDKLFPSSRRKRKK